MPGGRHRGTRRVVRLLRRAPGGAALPRGAALLRLGVGHLRAGGCLSHGARCRCGRCSTARGGSGEFRPLSNRKVIRRTIGLGDCFLVGVFASNTERKQLPRAIAGFAAAAGALPGLDLRLYLHCRWDGYWDVAELVERHGIADRMIGPGSSAHSEARGVPLDTWNASLGDLHDLGYAARLAVCDLIVNTPFSGDVEQVILEANSCGVALLHTDDDGIMAAAAGDAAVLLPAADVGTGPLGEARHHVDPRRVGQQIAWLAADEGARSALARRGLSNAARFPWSTLERAALEMVAPYAERSTGP